MALRTVGKEDARVESTMTTMINMVMIVIIIDIFSASIAKEEVRSCYGKWNFGPWTLRPGHFREEIQEA